MTITKESDGGRERENRRKKCEAFLGVNYNVHCEWFIDL